MKHQAFTKVQPPRLPHIAANNTTKYKHVPSANVPIKNMERQISTVQASMRQLQEYIRFVIAAVSDYKLQAYGTNGHSGDIQRFQTGITGSLRDASGFCIRIQSVSYSCMCVYQFQMCPHSVCTWVHIQCRQSTWSTCESCTNSLRWRVSHVRDLMYEQIAHESAGDVIIPCRKDSKKIGVHCQLAVQILMIALLTYIYQVMQLQKTCALRNTCSTHQWLQHLIDFRASCHHWAKKQQFHDTVYLLVTMSFPKTCAHLEWHRHAHGQNTICQVSCTCVSSQVYIMYHM